MNTRGPVVDAEAGATVSLPAPAPLESVPSVADSVDAAGVVIAPRLPTADFRVAAMNSFLLRRNLQTGHLSVMENNVFSTSYNRTNARFDGVGVEGEVIGEVKVLEVKQLLDEPRKHEEIVLARSPLGEVRAELHEARLIDKQSRTQNKSDSVKKNHIASP